MSDPAVTDVPVVTPGWKTSEFWLKLAAILLTALFASGVIPTTGAVAQVAAIAATILGALGYTVMRSNVKNVAAKAAALKSVQVPSGEVLEVTPPAPNVAIAIAPPASSSAAVKNGFVHLPLLIAMAVILALVSGLALTGCGARSKAAEAAFIDCEDAAVKAKVPDLLPTVVSILSSGGKDWKQQLDALVQYAGESTIACTVKTASAFFAKSKVGGALGGRDDEGLKHADDALLLHHWVFKAAPTP